MKTIGFIDYFLSEWHANNFPVWLDTYCAQYGKKWRVGYAWAELDMSPYDNVSTDGWCAKYGVAKCNTIDEVCAKSDAIIILAPDNPETHLKYSENVFKHGKPTYIDKTFAPDYLTAKKIFDLADKYKSPIFTASALGFASELDAFKVPVKNIISNGGGTALDGYIVHQLEMTVRLMGLGAEKVMGFAMSNSKLKSFCIKYGGERMCVINFVPPDGHSLRIEENKEIRCVNIESAFFDNLTAAIVEFFETGKPVIPKERTLELMAIRDAALEADSKPNTWINVIK